MGSELKVDVAEFLWRNVQVIIFRFIVNLMDANYAFHTYLVFIIPA